MALGSTLAISESSKRARRVRAPRGAKIVTYRKFSGMTPRLQQVRQLIESGLSDKDIATRLGISWRTVKIYASYVFSFTGKRRSELQRDGYRPLLESGDGLPRMGAFE